MDGDEVRRLRGWILQMLAEIPASFGGEPNFTNFEILFRRVQGVQAGVTTVRIEREIEYLGGKSYLEIKRFTGPAARIAGTGFGVRILPGGRDIVEQTTRDPGVDLGVFAG